jgi:hypothetical protein
MCRRSTASFVAVADIKQADIGLELRVGGTTLGIPQAVVDARPALKAYAGRQVALGGGALLRPGDVTGHPELVDVTACRI